MRIKAAGLKPILDAWLAKILVAVRGDWAPVRPGVEVKVPDDADVGLSADGDKLLVDLPAGIKLRIDPAELTMVPCHTSVVGSVTGAEVDAGGVTADLRDFLISSIRLEAAE